MWKNPVYLGNEYAICPRKTKVSDTHGFTIYEKERTISPITRQSVEEAFNFLVPDVRACAQTAGREKFCLFWWPIGATVHISFIRFLLLTVGGGWAEEPTKWSRVGGRTTN